MEFPLDDPSPVVGVLFDPVPASECQVEWLTWKRVTLDKHQLTCLVQFDELTFST